VAEKLVRADPLNLRPLQNRRREAEMELIRPWVPSPVGFAVFCLVLEDMGTARLRGLYVITDEALSPGRMHVAIATAALEGGARIVQLRDKNSSDRKFYEDAIVIRRLTREYGALFIINDRVHIAMAAEADGVNIGQNDIPIAAARRLLGPNAIIGVSADNIEQAKQAQTEGADYVGFGPVFPTNTKLDAGPVSGIETLRMVCAELCVPVVAIGGIGVPNIAQVAETGAACVAVVSAVVCAEDMVAATRELVERFKN
jgi:thiamine-phosphate pyrophosphorylase